MTPTTTDDTGTGTDELDVDDLERIEQCGTTPTGPIVHATTPAGTVVLLFNTDARIALEAAADDNGADAEGSR